jgi:hypothetical protein
MNKSVCPSCNNAIIPGSVYCDNCGRRLINPPADQSQPASSGKQPVTSFPNEQQELASSQAGILIKCSHCGAENAPGEASCKHCGQPLPGTSSDLQPPTGRICPQCNQNNIPGALFCADCGTALSSLPAPDDDPSYIPTPELEPYPASSSIEKSKVSFISGSLVIHKSSVMLPLPKDHREIIIGREDPVGNIFPDVDLEPHGGHESGVGRKHARLVMIEEQLCLGDLNSINGTFLNRQKINPGKLYPVKNGDEIRLGRFVITYQAD